jgi:DNA adenine methylase
VTLAAAAARRFPSYLLSDSLESLVELWSSIIENPEKIARGYETLWQREQDKPIAAFYEIRAEFNQDRAADKLLYLLARCVKNAVRFNPSGEFNQSPDKRRQGTNPRTMRAELLAAHQILGANCRAVHSDFFAVFEKVKPGDFLYLDPPYQGTSGGRDQRYIGGVTRERMIAGLEILNEKEIPFILSYDGSCGDRTYGEPLPDSVAHQLLLDVGRSSQSTLNGNDAVTIESLYISNLIAPKRRRGHLLSLQDFNAQAALFG